MKIAIDTRSMYLNKAGVRSYIKNLHEALKNIKDRKIQIIPMHGLNTEILPRKSFTKKHKILNGVSDILWTQIRLPILVRKYKIDALISPDYVAPILCPCISLVVFHDMTYRIFPEFYNSWHLWYHKIMIPLVARTADRIITVSEYSKMDIINMLSVHKDKIFVSHIAAARDFAKNINEEDLQNKLNKYGIGKEEYLLYLGTIEGRKNLPRLVESFAKLKTGKKIEIKLVLAGHIGWRSEYSRVTECIKSHSLEDSVIYIGYIDDEDIPYIYKGAKLYMYPSLYEGFGITLLEAFMCNTPVVSSNVTSIPEIAGDAALLVDPYDTKAMAEAMYRVITDKSLKESMIIKGKLQAEKFSWDKTAKEIVSEIERLMEAGY